MIKTSKKKYALLVRGKAIRDLKLVVEDTKEIQMLDYMIIWEILLWQTKIKGKL